MADFLLVFCPQQQGLEVEQIKRQLRRFGAHAVQQETNAETGLEQLQRQRFDDAQDVKIPTRVMR